ncbi:GTPase domain-containing protein [Actinotalea sp. JY-7876]|uniref:dynamin family protein n=2 Tax=unclassified Actinotalea TaxID=2638618 RepID=UPI0015F3D38B|nr:GTPase domain-containing protein [Actinotalea sp. JY-7876]
MAPSTSGLPPAVRTGVEGRPTGLARSATASVEQRPRASASLLDAVSDLRRDVDATRFPLPLPGVREAEERRVQLLDQLDDHLLPRLRELSAPAVVVVAGSTGAGKSTLVNSIVGREVSTAGVLRPTTRRPVLVHHGADTELLADHPLRDAVDVVVSDEVPRGIALVDAPDLDSLVESNRSTAHRLLEAADLWVFVTTAARYGDALPWQVLDRAALRGTSMAMVLNRVPDDALVTIRTDLMARLRARGLAAVPLFMVKDLGPHEGLLPPAAVAPMRRWLAMVAGPDRARAVITRTQRGAIAALRPWVEELADAVQAQVDAASALGAVVEEALGRTADAAVGAAREGAVVAGPVRARWRGAEQRRLLARRVPRRRRAERDRELAALRDDVVRAVAVVLAEASAAGRAGVRSALAASSLAGAPAVVTALDAQGAPLATSDDGRAAGEGHARAAAAQWAAATGGTGHAALDRRCGPEAGAVVVAAAAGLEPARALVSEVLGDAGGEVVERGTQELLALVAAEVRRGGEPGRAVLDAPDLAADAASLLRLRGAVLKAVR